MEHMQPVLRVKNIEFQAALFETQTLSVDLQITEVISLIIDYGSDYFSLGGSAIFLAARQKLPFFRGEF